MINRFKSQSEFTKNVLTLMTGTTIAQAVPVAISPILTRIYTPKDFGLFAIFLALSAVFGSIATGRYELAIMLPKKEEDAINIASLGLLITICISILLFVIVLLFNDIIACQLNNQEISVWLYFIPIAVFLTGLFNVLNYFNIRMDNYKDIAKATIYKSIVLAVFQISIGFLKSGATGLIFGQLISGVSANIKLLKNIIRDKKLVLSINFTQMKILAKRYVNFPKFSMLGIFINSVFQNGTNILISTFYSISTLGFYSLVQRVLGAPSALIGNSIAQVFFQQASKEKQKTGKAVITFISTAKKLFLVGSPLFLILFFIVEDLFAFIFGEDWRVAGYYAKIVTPLFFVRFISSTVSPVLSVFEKQKVELIIHSSLLVTALILFIVADSFEFNFYLFLSLFSFFMSLVYCVHFIYYFKLSKGYISV